MNTPTGFDWLEKNAERHAAKHGIRFEVAIGVFLDPDQLDAVDDRHDYGEERRNVVGVVDGTCLNVTYTMRGEIAWIISARLASRKERKRYGYRP